MSTMLMERYHTYGCSCGVPLVACAMGPTCPACGEVVPELDIAEHHQARSQFIVDDGKGLIAQAGFLKPKALFQGPRNHGRALKGALSLHIKNVTCDGNRRDRDRSVQLDTICQALGYPPTVQRFAWFYYMKVRRCEHVMNSNKLLAASLYAAARETIGCLSLQEIVHAFNELGFNVTKKDTARVHSEFQKYFPPVVVQPQRFLFKIMADLTTSARVKKALEKARVDMDEAFVEVVKRAIVILRANRALPGRASIKCAAAVCLAFNRCKVAVGARCFADIVGASEGNLRNVMAAMAKR